MVLENGKHLRSFYRCFRGVMAITSVFKCAMTIIYYIFVKQREEMRENYFLRDPCP